MENCLEFFDAPKPARLGESTQSNVWISTYE